MRMKDKGTRIFGGKTYYYSGRTIQEPRAIVLKLDGQGIKTRVTVLRGMGYLLWTDRSVRIELGEPNPLKTGMPRELEQRIMRKARGYFRAGYSLREGIEIAMRDKDTWVGYETWKNPIGLGTVSKERNPMIPLAKMNKWLIAEARKYGSAREFAREGEYGVRRVRLSDATPEELNLLRESGYNIYYKDLYTQYAEGIDFLGVDPSVPSTFPMDIFPGKYNEVKSIPSGLLKGKSYNPVLASVRAFWEEVTRRPNPTTLRAKSKERNPMAELDWAIGAMSTHLLGSKTPVQEVTRGFVEDVALRKRYQKEGFGLETVFGKQKWAEERVSELKQIYGLTDVDIRLVKHISTPETGEKPAWEIYMKAEKGLPVLLLV